MSYDPLVAECPEFIYQVSEGVIGMQWDPNGDPDGPNGDGTGIATLKPHNIDDITFDETGQPTSYGSTNQANFDSMIRRTSDWMVAKNNEAIAMKNAWGAMDANYQLLNPEPKSLFDSLMIDYVTPLTTVNNP